MEDKIREAIVDYTDFCFAKKKLYPSDEDIDNFKSILLKLTNLKPLSEKEVEKVLDEPIYSDEHTKMWVMARDKNLIAKLICSRFSKQIKYPEKKYTCGEGHEDIECDITNCETCKFNNEVENIEYNKAISDMKQLNGEGGV